MPYDYGVPEGKDGLLPWSWAEERLKAADNLWFSTTRPDGRPHAMPAWGVWLDGALYFEGSPATRRLSHLAKHANLSVHLEDALKVVILEGVAEAVPDPPRSLAERLAEMFTAKYGGEPWNYRPEPTQWDAGGLWLMRPRVAFGWTSFPADTTRWHFDS